MNKREKKNRVLIFEILERMKYKLFYNIIILLFNDLYDLNYKLFIFIFILYRNLEWKKQKFKLFK